MANLFDAIMLEMMFARFCATYGDGIYEAMHADKAFRADFVKRARRVVAKV
jgi:hypothetical protein